MSDTIIICSSEFGQTTKICEKIKARLEQRGESVTLVPLSQAPSSLNDHAKVLLACSIYHGKHRPEFYQYIEDHLDELNERPNAFFSVNLVARKPHKSSAETNPYVQAFLQKTPWKPKAMAVFGGLIDYQRYNFFDRHIIRFIMWMNKGPTDMNERIEFTQWDRVDQFADQIADMAE